MEHSLMDRLVTIDHDPFIFLTGDLAGGSETLPVRELPVRIAEAVGAEGARGGGSGSGATGGASQRRHRRGRRGLVGIGGHRRRRCGRGRRLRRRRLGCWGVRDRRLRRWPLVARQHHLNRTQRRRSQV